MDYEIIFESERILFVKLSEKLVNDYLDMVNDIEVQKYISHKRKTYTLEAEIEWIKAKINEQAIIFSMIDKATNEFIGNIEIMKINNNVGEIGIVITHKKQNNHYGQEAIKRLIDYSFEQLGLDGLELDVYNFNQRGIKCYEKAGFIKDGMGKTEEDIHMSIKKTCKMRKINSKSGIISLKY